MIVLLLPVSQQGWTATKRELYHHHFVACISMHPLDIHDGILLPELWLVIKCPLQFCVSQIQLNLQKSDYDSNREVDRKVMELAKVNLNEKKLVMNPWYRAIFSHL